MNAPHLILAVLTLAMCATAIGARLRPRWPLWVRAIGRIVLFVAITLLLQRVVHSPLFPDFGAAPPGDRFWERMLEAGWWIIAARGAVGLARLAVVLEHRPRETQIISDLLAGMIYVAAGLAIVNLAFDVPIRGVLATSGVIAIVLGLALQSSLADVFSGIAVGLERPFRVGDLIWVEGSIEGEVVQMNWRSTQISTGQNNIAIVPNSIIAKSRLINRSLPTPARGDKIEVRLDAMAAPERCIAALTAAAEVCRSLLPKPAPSVACTGLFGDGNIYEIDFSVASTANLMSARSELLRQVHHHLRYAGIAFGVAGLGVPQSGAAPTPSQLLAESDLFGVIEAEQRNVLANHLQEITLEPGETLIRAGEQPDALYVVAAGAIEITVPGPDGPRVVYRLSPGESIGAIGLITGAPYSATATALTHVKACRLDKAAISAAISAMPALKAGLEDLAKRGQKALRQDAAAQETHEPEHAEMFLSRLRNFISMLGH